MGVLTQFLAFVITILVLVSVHEAGHFFMAKLLGIKVLRFSIGFGKPLYRFHDRLGTEYVIAWIPLGGYVKLLDERETTVAETEQPLAFNRQPIWARTLVVLAGPAINLLFALCGFWLMYMNGVETARPIIGQVLPHSIAANAELKKDDVIVSIDDNKTVSMQKVALAIVERLGETEPLTMVTYDNQTKQNSVHVLNLRQWRIDPLNPDPLKSLGLVPARPALPAIIAQIETGSPAANAGLQLNDRLIAVNGQIIKDWYDFIEYVQLHPSQPIVLTLQRQGQTLAVKMTIGEKYRISLKPTGYLGVKPIPVKVPENLILYRQYAPGNAFLTAAKETWQYFKFNFIVIKKLILGQISVSTLGGPIAIFATADIAFQQGLSVFLGFLSLISVMLAFVNLLPIPGLDGGHLLNYLIEAITRKPLSIRYEMISIKVGMLLLLLMMLLATYNDILRLLLRS